MEFIYPFVVAFILVLVSELGDKTQLLVLSFATSVKTRTIILGVALRFIFEPWSGNLIWRIFRRH